MGAGCFLRCQRNSVTFVNITPCPRSGRLSLPTPTCPPAYLPASCGRGPTLPLAPGHPGTEPKLKYYLEVGSADPQAAAQLADRLVTAVADDLVQVAAAGLALPKH